MMRCGRDAALAAAVMCAFITAPVAVAAPEYPTDGTSCPDSELDPCYRSDQMNVFAETGERMVSDYLTHIGIAVDSLPALSFIPSGGSVNSQCVDVNGDANQNDRSFNYCPTDNAIYVGQNTLWDSYRRYQSLGPLSGLAHEYGHFLQSVLQVPLPRNATDTIRNENQADCFSGAFVGYLRDRGAISTPADITSVQQYLTATASVEAPGRDHGTARERVESFEWGYTGGLAACSPFYPATPLTR